MYYIDVRGCGIGNIVLLLSAFLEWCRAHGTMPVVVTDEPDTDLGGIRKDKFYVVPEPPVRGIPIHHAAFCTLSTLGRPDIVDAMRDILVERDDVDDIQCDAAFCIRTADARHDGDVRFMNHEAIAAMKEQMAKYAKVLVFTNDATNVGDLPPHAVVYEQTDASLRNAPSHWRQWHALGRCPVVYHGISGMDGSVASTFAATAAVFGAGGGFDRLIGVDNSGRLCFGKDYRW